MGLWRRVGLGEGMLMRGLWLDCVAPSQPTEGIFGASTADGLIVVSEPFTCFATDLQADLLRLDGEHMTRRAVVSTGAARESQSKPQSSIQCFPQS